MPAVSFSDRRICEKKKKKRKNILIGNLMDDTLKPSEALIYFNRLIAWIINTIDYTNIRICSWRLERAEDTTIIVEHFVAY